MVRRPAFRRHFHVEVLPGEGVVLVSERGGTLLRGEVYERIAPLIDGASTPDEIADRLAGEVELAQVYYALSELESKGYIVEAHSGLVGSTEAFWHSMGVDALAAESAVSKTAVAVCSFLNLPTKDLVKTLERLGLSVEMPGDITIVLVDDYLRPELKAFNQRALQNSRPWLLAKPVGAVLWIGPLFVPGGGCWSCLEHRLRRNRPVDAYLSGRKELGLTLPAGRSTMPSTFEAAMSLVATQLVRWIGTGTNQDLIGAIMTFDTKDLRCRRHPVTRRPQCPACGDPNLDTMRMAQPVTLRTQAKCSRRDGRHRSIAPRAFLRRVRHLVGPLTGVVRSMRKLPVGNSLVHIYAVPSSVCDPSRGLSAIAESLRHPSGGKGMTDRQARASAIGEAVERYSGAFHGDEPHLRASLVKLGGRSIHPNDCMLFSEAQYRARDDWNLRYAGNIRVPMPFDPTAPIDWTPVWSLTRSEQRFLPTTYLYYGHPDSSQAGFCWADSNGCAAGATLEEAILQGLLELIERDAAALWWYNNISRPAVGLDTLPGSQGPDLITSYRSLDREIWVLEITSDLGIPVFAAVSRRREGPADQILLGFGAHLDPEIALLHAVCELNQSAFALHGRTGDGIDGQWIRSWFHDVALSNQTHLLPASGPHRQLHDYPVRAHDDLREDIRECQNAIEGAGMEVLVLDQTRSDIQVPVVKVLVPGLRHFWPRLAPGRLYDIPARMGWIPRPLVENELNPIPLLF